MPLPVDCRVGFFVSCRVSLDSLNLFVIGAHFVLVRTEPVGLKYECTASHDKFGGMYEVLFKNYFFCP